MIEKISLNEDNMPAYTYIIAKKLNEVIDLVNEHELRVGPGE